MDWSPAPVMIRWSSGSTARYSTLFLWPRKTCCLARDVLSQMLTQNLLYPWVLIKLAPSLMYLRLHTCDPVSMHFSISLVLVFHILMVLSSLPPPEARMPDLLGCHEMPRIAALCLYTCTGLLMLVLHTTKFLSLEPDAKVSEPVSRHLLFPCALTLQISWLWNLYRAARLLTRMSSQLMQASLPPESRQLGQLIHSTVPTLPSWCAHSCRQTPLSASQISTPPPLFPQASK